MIAVEEGVLASNEMAELVSRLQEERSGAVNIVVISYCHQKNTITYLQKTITATALAKHENVASREALQITIQPIRPALSPESRQTLSANSPIT